MCVCAGRVGGGGGSISSGLLALHYHWRELPQYHFCRDKSFATKLCLSRQTRVYREFLLLLSRLLLRQKITFVPPIAPPRSDAVFCPNK